MRKKTIIVNDKMPASAKIYGRAGKKTVIVNDLMQKNYRYVLTEPVGKNFDKDFKPELSPKEMLELGVFG